MASFPSAPTVCFKKKKKKKTKPFYFRKLERFTKVENRVVGSSSKTYDSSTLPLKKKFFFFLLVHFKTIVYHFTGKNFSM